jgi:hypothetical protein
MVRGGDVEAVASAQGSEVPGGMGKSVHMVPTRCAIPGICAIAGAVRRLP